MSGIDVEKMVYGSENKNEKIKNKKSEAIFLEKTIKTSNRNTKVIFIEGFDQPSKEFLTLQSKSAEQVALGV